MNDQSSSSLGHAKQEFVSLLSKLNPGESKDFFDWIIEQHSLLRNEETSCDVHNSQLFNAFEQCVNSEESLQSIVDDLRGRLPLSGICGSEVMFKPEIGQNSDCNPATTVVIDSFLYDEDDIDMLCDGNQFSRNYCKDCGSHNTAPLSQSFNLDVVKQRTGKNVTKITKSSIVLQKNRMITDFTNTTLIDVGSRLGAVLYGAYYFSKFNKIVGVEMNAELCHIQNEIIHKYTLGNRVETVCSDVCKVGELLNQADVILLNNTFEFFLQRDVQISTWQNIRHNIRKSGCILITVPSLEESVCIGDEGQPILDVNSWLVPLNVNASDLKLDYSEDELEELSNIHFYKVK